MHVLKHSIYTQQSSTLTIKQTKAEQIKAGLTTEVFRLHQMLD